MKRMNLAVSRALLEEAHRQSGERTLSDTVNRAIEQFVLHLRAHTSNVKPQVFERHQNRRHKEV